MSIACNAGSSNPVHSTTMRFEPPVGGNPLQEAVFMDMIPTQAHPLLAVPFTVATDFTVLAEHCENYAETLIETTIQC